MVISRAQKKQNFYNDFLEAQDLKEFLKKAFETSKKANSRFSYEFAARKGGFGSKTHLYQIVSGKRKLTFENCPKIKKAFGFDSKVMKGIGILLEVETNKEMRSELLKFKKKISSEIKRSPLDQIQHVHWPLIYTALTPFNKFLSLKVVEKKCMLTSTILKRELENMIEAGIVEKNDNGEYRSVAEHVSIGALAKSGIYQDLFLRSLSRAKTQALRNFDSSEKLFFNSYFTIKTSNIDEFTTKLQELMGEFCSDAVDDDGDKVLTVVASAF